MWQLRQQDRAAIAIVAVSRLGDAQFVVETRFNAANALVETLLSGSVAHASEKAMPHVERLVRVTRGGGR